jgi:hypothetical protein
LLDCPLRGRGGYKKSRGTYNFQKIFRVAARAGREFIFPTPLFLPAPPEQISVLFLPRPAKRGGATKNQSLDFLGKKFGF